GPAQQVQVPLVGHGLALVGQHDRDVVTYLVNAAQPWVVQDTVVGQVQQGLLVDRAGQQVQQQRIQTHVGRPFGGGNRRGERAGSGGRLRAGGTPLGGDGQDDRDEHGGDAADQAQGQQHRAGRQPLVEQPRADDDQVAGADD